MNDSLDQALVLADLHAEKPSKPYRTSCYTVRQYCALPYAQRRAVDAACDEAAGLVRTEHADESSPQPYTIGRRTLAPAPKRCPESTFCPTTSITSNPMTSTDFVHPAPSPAQHALNTPERIAHDTTHPDNLATSATEAEVVGPTCPYPGPAFASLTQAIAEAALPQVPTAPLAHAAVIYETTEYDVFHLLPENRAIDPNHVRKLVALIQQHNLLHLKPLDVTQDFGVIDGQHRLAAARELGLPIFYKVGEQLSEADISTLNLAGKNWSGTDWLKYWAVKRRPAYVALADFMARHPRLSFSNAKIMLSGTSSGHGAEIFRAGRWDGAEDEAVALADQVAELVECIAAQVPTFKSPAHTGFVTVLYQCFAQVEGFDGKEMLRTILLQPRTLVTCSTQKQWLQMLSDIYNYRKYEQHRLRFE